MPWWSGLGTHRREDLWEGWEEVVETAPNFFFFKSPIPKDICFFFSYHTPNKADGSGSQCNLQETGAWCLGFSPSRPVALSPALLRPMVRADFYCDGS